MKVREALLTVYANLAMADAAVKDGSIYYNRLHRMIRGKSLREFLAGNWKFGSLADDHRISLQLAEFCSFCGGRGELTLDHLWARNAGGVDDLENLVRSCRPCNSSKGKKELIEWFLSSGRFPPLMLLRRYMKGFYAKCEEQGRLVEPAQTLPPGMLRMLDGFPEPWTLRANSATLPDDVKSLDVARLRVEELWAEQDLACKGRCSLMDLLASLVERQGPSHVLLWVCRVDASHLTRLADMYRANHVLSLRLFLPREFPELHPEHYALVELLFPGASGLSDPRRQLVVANRRAGVCCLTNRDLVPCPNIVPLKMTLDFDVVHDVWEQAVADFTEPTDWTEWRELCEHE